MSARTFPVMHPRLPDGTPVCIGDRLVFGHPDDESNEVVVEVGSLHYDHTNYDIDPEGPLGWIVTDIEDDTFEYAIEDVIRVESLGPDRWGVPR